EEGWVDNKITKKITKAICEEYLSELKGKIDVLILGCTHYPFLLQTIKEVMGDNTYIVSSSSATAIATKALLEKEGLLNTKGGKIRFYTSDTPDDFMLKAAGFLDISITDIQRIDLEEYEGSISRKV
ncbi:MAG: glutamate racemase, partial [bacterium]